MVGGEGVLLRKRRATTHVAVIKWNGRRIRKERLAEAELMDVEMPFHRDNIVLKDLMI